MQNLLKKITESKTLALAQLARLSAVRVEKTLHMIPDEAATPYEKSIEKNYALFERVNFSDSYSRLFNATLHDFGLRLHEDKLTRKVMPYGTKELEYDINALLPDEAVVEMRGSVRGDVSVLSSNYPVAIFDIIGLTTSAAKKLDFLETLILEGFALEESGNRKTSFFTYFSAIETLCATFLESFKTSIPKELHHAAEHLALDDKLRIIVRLNVAEPDKIALWGGLMGSFKGVKGMRNDIAHGTKQTDVGQEDVDLCFMCLATLYALLKGKCKTFTDVRRFLYPKAQALPSDFGWERS